MVTPASRGREHDARSIDRLPAGGYAPVVTRARDRSRRPPRVRGRRLQHGRLPVAALGLAGLLVLAGCGSDAPPSAPSGSPAGTSSPSASATAGGGAASPTVAASADVSASPEPTGDAGSSSGTPGTGPAAGCSGNAANREFFASVAVAVSWSVYCGVVPDGWFVESGSYRLRAGGQMIVAYRGPSGARLELREGAFCADAVGCVPGGQSTGSAQFGDRSGTFLELDGGGYAVAVDAGQPVAWLAIGANLDEATFRTLAASLRLVPGA